MEFSITSTNEHCIDYDVCEVFFSKVGGIIQNEMTYDGFGIVESACGSARIDEFEVDLKDPSLVHNILTFGLTLSLMEMPSCGFGV